MPVAGSLIYDTKIDSSGFDKGLNGLSSSVIAKGQLMADAFKAVAKEIVNLGKSAINYNATIEQYQTSFEVMTGSAEEAVKLVQELKELGAATPFEMTDLAETTQLLMNYGFEAEEAVDRLKMLGDISQGSAEKMNRIAMAYGQMSSAGKVQLEDIKQMIEAGFNPLQEISQSTGESMASLYDRISKGTISVDEITESMIRSTSAGGKYFQSMEKQSKTLNGQLSTLQDNFNSLTGTIAQDATSAITNKFLPAINELLQNLEEGFSENGFSGMADAFQNFIDGMITYVDENADEIVDTLISTIGTIGSKLLELTPSLLQAGISIVLSLVEGMIEAVPQIIPQFILFMQEMLGLIQDNLPLIIDAGINLVMALIDSITSNLPQFVMTGIDILLAIATGLIDAIPELISRIPQIIIDLVMALTDPEMLLKLKSIGPTLMLAIAKALIENIPNMLTAVPEIIIGLFNGFKDRISNTDWLELGRSILRGILNGILDFGNIVKNTVKKVGKKITNEIKDFFGIHSPSTLMQKEVGKFIPSGIAVGIDDNLSSVMKAIDNMDNEIYDKVKRSVALETGNVNAQAKVSSVVENNRTIQINATFTGEVDMDGDKVGRIITPSITQTLKAGGLR